MIAELLQERAALFVSGAMGAPERACFEVILESDPVLQAEVAALEAALVTTVMARVEPVAVPPAGLKERLLSALDALPDRPEPEARVVTDGAGLVRWVNPAFTTLCGYTLEELRGRKPGHLLQGAETDPAAVARIRAAMGAGRACREQLVNYHKDGSRYTADVWIEPLLDDEHRPVFFVARERRVAR